MTDGRVIKDEAKKAKRKAYKNAWQKKKYRDDAEHRERLLKTGNAAKRMKYATDPVFREKVLAVGIKYRQTHLESVAAYARGYYLRTVHGMTNDDYEAMLEAQDGKCSICSNSEGRLVIDHSHSSGIVRSILCDACNLMIGHGREDPKLLRCAASYLEFHNHA